MSYVGPQTIHPKIVFTILGFGNAGYIEFDGRLIEINAKSARCVDSELGSASPVRFALRYRKLSSSKNLSIIHFADLNRSGMPVIAVSTSKSDT